MVKSILAFLIFIVSTCTALADSQLKPTPFSVKQMHFGGGLSYNTVSSFKNISDEAFGYQFLLGYDMGMRFDQLQLLVEAGYQNSGEFKDEVGTAKLKERIRGVWTAGVLRYPVNDTLNVLARLGYDGGDDRGILFGGGVGFWPTQHLGFRGEIVIRDEMDSFQLNILYRP